MRKILVRVFTVICLFCSCLCFVFGCTAEHTHSYEKEVRDPTCTEGGYTVYSCECGDSYTADFVDLMEHNFVNGFCIACEEAEYFNFKLLDNNTYTISAKNTLKIPSVLLIPSLYKGVPITSIGDFGFSDCSSIVTLEIPSSIVSIGNRAFGGCSALTSIVVAEDNQNYCSLNGNLYSKDKTTLIQYAIGKQEGTFIIPKSVTTIKSYAFDNCLALSSIEIHSSVTSIGDSAFGNCSSLTSIDVSEDSQSYCSLNDDLYNKDKTTLIQYAIGKQENSFVVPDGVTTIENSAFTNCSSLTVLTIADSVTTIGNSAFTGCVIEEVSLPTNAISYIPKNKLKVVSITSGSTIEDKAFYNLKTLVSVSIADSVTSIGDSAFGNCSSLTSIDVSEDNQSYSSLNDDLYNKDKTTLIQYAIGKQENSFVVPDGVSTIEN